MYLPVESFELFESSGVDVVATLNLAYTKGDLTGLVKPLKEEIESALNGKKISKIHSERNKNEVTSYFNGFSSMN